jgi:hypothetical protein
MGEVEKEASFWEREKKSNKVYFYSAGVRSSAELQARAATK